MAALLKLAAATTFSRTTTLAGIVSRRNIVLSNRYFGDRKRRDSRSSDGADATENRVEKKGATIKRKVDEIAQKFDDMISEDKILPNTDNPMKMNYTSPPVTERVVDSVKQILIRKRFKRDVRERRLTVPLMRPSRHMKCRSRCDVAREERAANYIHLLRNHSVYLADIYFPNFGSSLPHLPVQL